MLGALLLSFGPAAGADLAWECPEVATPADAAQYRNDDGGVWSAIDTISGMIAEYDSYPCTWTETSTGWGTLLVCDDGVVHYEILTEDYCHVACYGSLDSATLTVASGETWTTLSYERTGEGGGDDLGNEWSTSTTRVDWVGAVDGLMDDGWASAMSGSSYDSGLETDDSRHSTPVCDWSWSLESYDWDWYQTIETVDVSGLTEVVVYGGESYACPDAYPAPVSYATLDGVMYGAVDGETWADDPADVDRDGWWGAADCDDADPARSYCTTDIANDGIDQDCDGADAVSADWDRDGYDNAGAGGDDCDDYDEDVHPEARDAVGDGLDQDCDGADDVDADGDGFTADGDSWGADCDETDPEISPRESDIPYDGIDQDCDGEDDMDADNDGVDYPDDCDDSDRFVSPDEAEIDCDGIDQDCDGADSCPDTDTTTDTATDTGAGEPPPAADDDEVTSEEPPGCFHGPLPPPALLGALAVILASRRRS